MSCHFFGEVTTATQLAQQKMQALQLETFPPQRELVRLIAASRSHTPVASPVGCECVPRVLAYHATSAARL